MRRSSLQFNYQDRKARQWGWVRLRFESLFLSWALMEMALLAPLTMLLFLWDTKFSTIQIALIILFCILFPFYLVRVLSWAAISRQRQRQILVITAVFALIFSLYSLENESTSILNIHWIGHVLRNFATADTHSWQPILGAFVIILSWWRGISLVSHYVVTARAFGFRIRHYSLVYLPIIVTLATLQNNWNIVPFIALYFFVAPIALILTRIEETEREYGAILKAVTPRWLATIAGSSAFLAFCASGTAVFVSGQWQTVILSLSALWLGLQLSLASSILTMAYLASPFLVHVETLLHFLFRMFRLGIELLFEPNLPPETHDFQSAPNEWLIEKLTQPAQETLFTHLNWRILFLFILGTLIILTLILLSHYFRQDKTIYGYGRFSKFIVELSQNIIRPIFQPNKRKTRSRWHDWKTAVSITKIYKNMLQTAAQYGYSRDKSETPFEYLATLKLIWPNNQKEAKIITDAYVNIKYGQFPESEEELRSIQDSWHIIKNIEPIRTKNEKG